jgi:hypothetical protein
MPNKKTLKKRKNLNKKKGGHIMPITDENIQSWIPLSCRTGADCGPNTFAFLRYASRDLMEEMGRTTFGILFPRPIFMLTNEFGIPHSMTIIYSNGADLDTNLIVRSIIPPGYGTLAAFINDEGNGHYATIAVDTDNNIVYLDPQTNEIYVNDDIGLHIQRQGWNSVYLYHQTDVFINRERYFRE